MDELRCLLYSGKQYPGPKTIESSVQRTLYTREYDNMQGMENGSQNRVA